MSKIVINPNEAVTGRLPFEVYEAYGHIALGFLNKVSVEESTSEPDTKWEYKGMTFKRLVFEFVQLKDAYNKHDRFLTVSQLPVAFEKSNGIERKEKDVIDSYRNLWARIKHIHDSFASAKNYKPITTVPDFDTALEPGQRIEQFNTFFVEMAKAFNEGTDGKPIYQPFDITKIEGAKAIKLIASGEKSNYLAIPNFVGKGFIEPAVLENGKLSTTLRFGSTETPILGSVAVKAPEQQMSNSEGLASLLKGNLV